MCACMINHILSLVIKLIYWFSIQKAGCQVNLERRKILFDFGYKFLFIYLFIFLFIFFFFFFFFVAASAAFVFHPHLSFLLFLPLLSLHLKTTKKKTLFSLRLRLHWCHFCQPCDPFLLIWRGLSLLHLHLLFIQHLFLCLPIFLAEYWRIQLPSSSSSSLFYYYYYYYYYYYFYLLQLWIDPQNSNKMRWLNDLSGIYSYPPDK